MIEQKSDKLVNSPICDSNACYESEFMTAEGPIKTWLCMTCGFTTNTQMIEGSDLVQLNEQNTAELIKDLKQRGLLEDTLVIWGGEFGRTNYSQGMLKPDNYGRDHHPRCFTIFMAGAGVKKGITIGSTDEFGYNIAERPVHIHDFQATLMHLLGIDHEKLTFKFQGRRYRLTDVHGNVVNEVLA